MNPPFKKRVLVFIILFVNTTLFSQIINGKYFGEWKLGTPVDSMKNLIKDFNAISKDPLIYQNGNDTIWKLQFEKDINKKVLTKISFTYPTSDINWAYNLINDRNLDAFMLSAIPGFTTAQYCIVSSDDGYIIEGGQLIFLRGALLEYQYPN